MCNTHKKCGAHTHAHYLSQLSSSIFTSVVVYSRTSNKQLEPTQTRVVLLIARVLCVGRVRFMTNDLIKTKKNAEHTRMYTIFRNFLSQYSRRLLSILAQRKPKNNYQNLWCEGCNQIHTTSVSIKVTIFCLTSFFTKCSSIFAKKC